MSWFQPRNPCGFAEIGKKIGHHLEDGFRTRPIPMNQWLDVGIGKIIAPYIEADYLAGRSNDPLTDYRGARFYWAWNFAPRGGGKKQQVTGVANTHPPDLGDF